MKKVMALVMIFILVGMVFGACAYAEDNISYAQRRLVVFNTNTDTVLVEMIGRLGFTLMGDRLKMSLEIAPDVYRESILFITDDLTLISEGLEGAFEDEYHYEVHYLPEKLQEIH